MKCIQCQNDAKYPERTDGKCPRCRHRFAFEPKTGDKLTDAAFQAALERVSSGGTVKFTLRHLYYQVAQRAQRRSKVAPWLLGGFTLVGAVVSVAAAWQVLLPTALLAYLTMASLPSKLTKLDESEFEHMWRKWLSVHGKPPGLVVRRPSPPGREPPSLPRDILHYSFDRAVVTDREDTVDLLLANNFHFENNCAVLAVNGYPAGAFETVRAMLRQNPKLQVYVLHDASAVGCQLAQRVRKEGWFMNSARIIDVGLSPRHAGVLKGCWKPSTYAATTALAHGLAEADAEWLKRYSLELAAIRPEQIIKRLFGAMTRADQQGGGGDGGGGGGGSDGVFVDDASFSSDSHASDGGGDSFG